MPSGGKAGKTSIGRRIQPHPSLLKEFMMIRKQKYQTNKIPIPKKKIPNNFQLPKLQISNRKRFGYWKLDFEIYLKFGCWNLEFFLQDHHPIFPWPWTKIGLFDHDPWQSHDLVWKPLERTALYAIEFHLSTWSKKDRSAQRRYVQFLSVTGDHLPLSWFSIGQNQGRKDDNYNSLSNALAIDYYPTSVFILRFRLVTSYKDLLDSNQDVLSNILEFRLTAQFW